MLNVENFMFRTTAFLWCSTSYATHGIFGVDLLFGGRRNYSQTSVFDGAYLSAAARRSIKPSA